jgi:hypothetical protein
MWATVCRCCESKRIRAHRQNHSRADDQAGKYYGDADRERDRRKRGAGRFFVRL